MKAKRAKILFSYQEELQKSTLRDWLVSHISFLLPAHRHKGIMELDSESLRIDNSSGENIILRKSDVLDVYYGFDEVYKFSKDRSLGLTYKPLRINYARDHLEKTIYVISDFNRFVRTSKNKEWYDALMQWKSKEMKET